MARPHLPPFQTLLDAHGEDVLRYLRVAVGPHDADDCFQDTVLAALRAYPDLEHADNLRGWLLVIARRKALDAHRRRGRRTGAPATQATQAMAVDPPEPPDDGLWTAVALLTAAQRDALALRVVADLPYADVAAALGCSQPAARQRVRAALQRLREEYRDD